MKQNLSHERWIVFLLIALGAFARLAPHPWNFTPIMAIGLYAGARCASLALALLVTVAALLASDAILGFYSGMWYVYSASLIPVLLGWRISRRYTSIRTVAASALLSSLSFFIITNAAVWATGTLYPHTGSGLAACFTAALPFYRNQIAGDAFYTLALFGADALFRTALRNKPQVA